MMQDHKHFLIFFYQIRNIDGKLSSYEESKDDFKTQQCIIKDVK